MEPQGDSMEPQGDSMEELDKLRLTMKLLREPKESWSLRVAKRLGDVSGWFVVMAFLAAVIYAMINVILTYRGFAFRLQFSEVLVGLIALHALRIGIMYQGKSE